MADITFEIPIVHRMRADSDWSPVTYSPTVKSVAVDIMKTFKRAGADSVKLERLQDIPDNLYGDYRQTATVTVTASDEVIEALPYRVTARWMTVNLPKFSIGALADEEITVTYRLLVDHNLGSSDWDPTITPTVTDVEKAIIQAADDAGISDVTLLPMNDIPEYAYGSYKQYVYVEVTGARPLVEALQYRMPYPVVRVTEQEQMILTLNVEYWKSHHPETRAARAEKIVRQTLNDCGVTIGSTQDFETTRRLPDFAYAKAVLVGSPQRLTEAKDALRELRFISAVDDVTAEKLETPTAVLM